MPNNYPRVDISFIENEILISGKIVPNSKIKVGNSLAFILEGTGAIHRRFITIRPDINGEISFELATKLAINMKFMKSLLGWLENEKSWKEGEYIQQ
ncbi:MAG: hypothetical protein EOO43_26270 [Flavobacterium sp.]|nr:MAG: hypothetical protein EOO43_26270 [Flavobacterium sp.]